VGGVEHGDFRSGNGRGSSLRGRKELGKKAGRTGIEMTRGKNVSPQPISQSEGSAEKKKPKAESLALTDRDT